jgi:4-hydroxy-2-oxoheptanedioate aldolase
MKYGIQNERKPCFKKLRAGKIASCFKLNLNDGQIADLVAGMGFDCLWTDMEHQANDWDVIKRSAGPQSLTM